MIEDRERMLDEVLSETPPPGREKSPPSDVGNMSPFAQLLIHYLIECDKEGVHPVHRDGDESVVTLDHRLWEKACEARDLAPPLSVGSMSRRPGGALQLTIRRKTGSEPKARKAAHVSESFREVMEKLREAQERGASPAGYTMTTPNWVYNPSVSDSTTDSTTISTVSTVSTDGSSDGTRDGDS